MKINQTIYGSAGATIVELLLVIAIAGVLLRVVTLGAFRSQQRISLVEARDKLVRDLRRQQYRAMTGVTGSGGANFDYSVYFESNRYILFPGTVYSAGNTENVVQPLDSPFQLTSIQFSQSTVTFARVSGDMRNYDISHSSLVLTNTQTGDQVMISINPRGVVRAEFQ